MSLAGAAARGGAATLAGQVFRFLIQFASVALLARLISPEQFGLYTMVFAILGIATILGDFGLSTAAVQSQQINHQQRSNLFWTNALLGTVLFGLVIGLAPLISLLYGHEELTAIARVMAIVFLLNAFSAQFRAELSARLRFSALAVIDVVAAVFGFMVAIVVAVLEAGYWALVAQQIAMATTALLGLVIGARWIPAPPRRTEGMGAFYRFGINTLGVQVLTYATSNIDSILIGRVWGAAPLGVYDRAFQLFRLPLQQIAAPLTKVGVPVLSKLQDDRARYESFVHRGQLVLGYAFGGAFFLAAALASPIIEILLGPGWEAAKPVLAVLAIGGVFQGMGYVYAWVFLSLALTGLQLRWSIIGRSAMVVAICIGLPWGILGVAMGATIGSALNWVILTLLPMAKTGISRRPLLLIALRPVVLYTPMTLVLVVLSYTVMKDWSPWLEAVVSTAAALAYLAASALLPSIRRDFDQLLDTLRRFRR